nr:thiamine biosynthetic bifunctional enzyme TH1, chloroplastic isoform X1 [Tanacetum cinerariifolium]
MNRTPPIAATLGCGASVILGREPVLGTIVYGSGRDPVLETIVSGSGRDTIRHQHDLLPMADIVTPNLKEASALLGGLQLETVTDMRTAAKSLHDMGPRNVLVKGGDLPSSSDAVDIFFNGKDFYELRSSRIKTRNTHGTGCTMASCIAAELAKGSSMLSAVKVAKQYVETALEYSKSLNIGKGPQGPFDHLFKLKRNAISSSRLQPFEPSDLFLYAVTDSGMNKRWGRSITDAVRAAILGGATIVQIRMEEKDHYLYETTLSMLRASVAAGSLDATLSKLINKHSLCFLIGFSCWHKFHMYSVDVIA